MQNAYRHRQGVLGGRGASWSTALTGEGGGERAPPRYSFYEVDLINVHFRSSMKQIYKSVRDQYVSKLILTGRYASTSHDLSSTSISPEPQKRTKQCINMCPLCCTILLRASYKCAVMCPEFCAELLRFDTKRQMTQTQSYRV